MTRELFLFLGLLVLLGLFLAWNYRDRKRKEAGKEKARFEEAMKKASSRNFG